MQYRRLGKTEYQISPVVFGGVICMDETQADADRYVAEAVESGVNYFDVAPSYGDAQDRLGPALAPYRQRVYLACKTLERDASGAKAELLHSLSVLQTDYLDLYQFHGVNTWEDLNAIFAPGGAMETALWARREGIIRAIGFSTHNETVACAMTEHFRFDTALFPMNWAMGMELNWGSRISRIAAEQDMGLLAMKTFIHRQYREGDAHPYPKSWAKPIDDERTDLMQAAMAFAFSRGAAALVPPGNIRHFRMMRDLVDGVTAHPLDDAQRALLRREAELVRNELLFDPPY